MSPGVCRTAAVALTGLEGTIVHVEAAVSNQLPGMVIIGLPDAALAEAKQRVRLATQQAGMPLSERLLIVNLSPAALPKQGSGFDLAIALSALAASGHLPTEQLAEVAHIGELSLDGGLRRPPGLLSAVLAAKELGFDRVMVPAACAREAALVPGIEVIAAESLSGAVAWYRGDQRGWHIAASEIGDSSVTTAPQRSGEADMSDVIGQPEMVEALVVAAAGRHHLSMIGPPGAGKTLLAIRLGSILPDLTPAESITASSIASLGGAPLTDLVRRPPFESPHHTASAISIIGGGDSSGVRPGAVTRACHGVLFLDEARDGKCTSLNKEEAHEHITTPARRQCSSRPYRPIEGLSGLHADRPRVLNPGDEADLSVFAVVEVPQGQGRRDRAAEDRLDAHAHGRGRLDDHGRVHRQRFCKLRSD